MLLSVQVSGYAQKTVVMTGARRTAMVMYVTRITHQQTSMTSIGTDDLPAPRKMAAIQ